MNFCGDYVPEQSYEAKLRELQDEFDLVSKIVNTFTNPKSTNENFFKIIKKAVKNRDTKIANPILKKIIKELVNCKMYKDALNDIINKKEITDSNEFMTKQGAQLLKLIKNSLSNKLPTFSQLKNYEISQIKNTKNKNNFNFDALKFEIEPNKQENYYCEQGSQMFEQISTFVSKETEYKREIQNMLINTKQILNATTQQSSIIFKNFILEIEKIIKKVSEAANNQQIVIYKQILPEFQRLSHKYQIKMNEKMNIMQAYSINDLKNDFIQISSSKIKGSSIKGDLPKSYSMFLKSSLQNEEEQTFPQIQQLISFQKYIEIVESSYYKIL